MSNVFTANPDPMARDFNKKFLVWQVISLG